MSPAFEIPLYLFTMACLAGVVFTGAMYLRRWLIEQGLLMKPYNWDDRVKKEDRL